MRLASRLAALAAAFLAALAAAPALAVMSGEMSTRAPSGDPDYAEGVAAWREMDHAGMVAPLERVVARRPWHDNAHTLLGYAYRRLGDYDRAFEHYAIALERNGRHRGALSYMGVAYLHLDDLAQAEATLARLSGVCSGMMLKFSDGDFDFGCEEALELRGAIDHYVATGEVLDLCPDVGFPARF